MEINQGVSKSHGPLPSELSDTLSETQKHAAACVVETYRPRRLPSPGADMDRL